MQFNNYWLTTLQLDQPGEAPDWPHQVDVAVIGAGFTGLAAALALAQAGASVAVLEAEEVGWGASSRNGGMTLSGLKLGVETLQERYGPDTARRWFAASLQSIDLVESLVAQHHMDCDFYRSGHVELAYKPAHFKTYTRAAEQLARHFGHTVQVLSRQDLAQEISSQVYHGGLLDTSSAALNPARYVHGLAAAARRAGARVYEHCAVQQVQRAGAGWQVQTQAGSLRAGQVIVATSGYTGRATPDLQRRVIPIGSYIITTPPLPEPLAQALDPHRRMFFDSKHFLYYFRLTPDRRLLFGGRASFTPESPATLRRSAEILRQGMTWVYPQLSGTPVDYVWGGTLDFTFDWMPHTGQSGGLHYALGYAGHGVALATLLGTRLGQALSSADGALQEALPELALPGAPLGLGFLVRPLLPLAGWWFKLLDWLT